MNDFFKIVIAIVALFLTVCPVCTGVAQGYDLKVSDVDWEASKGWVSLSDEADGTSSTLDLSLNDSRDQNHILKFHLKERLEIGKTVVVTLQCKEPAVSPFWVFLSAGGNETSAQVRSGQSRIRIKLTPLVGGDVLSLRVADVNDAITLTTVQIAAASEQTSTPTNDVADPLDAALQEGLIFYQPFVDDKGPVYSKSPAEQTCGLPLADILKQGVLHWQQHI